MARFHLKTHQALDRFRVDVNCVVADPRNAYCLVMLLRLLHETGRVYILRLSAFARFYLAVFAARAVFMCVSIVLPILYDDDIDTAGIITTGIELGATICFFATITDAVGDCNSELERHTDTLLLARLQLCALGGQHDAAARSHAAEAIDRMIAVLQHHRTHKPLEFCGLESSQQFLRLLLGMLGGCLSLTAAWFISTSTAPVVQVLSEGNGTTSVSV